MSDLNIRNNLHTGIEFDAQGSNLVTVTGFSDWLTFTIPRTA